MSKIYNFSAGPSMLPSKVINEISQELNDWQGQGCSVMEVSHRGEAFMKLANDSIADLRSLYDIPSNYEVLFAHGGQRGQFAAIPMNIEQKHGKALYLISGHWSRLAAQEAQKYTQVVCFDLTDKQGNLIKSDWEKEAENVDYVYYCTNETVDGIEIFNDINTGDTPLIADMSSDILSRKIDVSKFAVITSGVQKNIGPSGLCLIIVRNDLLNKPLSYCPTILDWTITAKYDSMINTPNTFSWYVCSKVFKLLLSNGGIEKVEEVNKQKAKLLYDYIDNSDFYFNNINPLQRSLMNVVFRTLSTELDLEFCKQASKLGLKSLKGHKVVGGIRASIYNAMPLEGIKKLIEFMQEFAKQNK